MIIPVIVVICSSTALSTMAFMTMVNHCYCIFTSPLAWLFFQAFGTVTVLEAWQSAYRSCEGRLLRFSGSEQFRVQG